MTTYPAPITTARILAERAILYRPRLKLLTGNINAAILLSQVNYWWFERQQTAFYKFAAPCNHKLYKTGDSWREELGFTRTELETALKYIGTKTHNPEERDALRAEVPAGDALLPVSRIVLYWRDSDNVTWYELNTSLQDAHLALSYASSECRKPAFDECGNPALPGNVENLQSSNVENPHYPLSESTTKRKKKKNSAAAQTDTSPATKPARKRNPLFDAVAKHLFGAVEDDTAAVAAIAPSANKLVTFLKSRAPEVTPEAVAKFNAWCVTRRQDMKFMRYLATFTPAWLEYEQAQGTVSSSSGTGKRRRVFYSGAWVDAARLSDDNTIDGQVRPSYTLAEIASAGDYGGVALAAGEKVYHDGSLPLAWQGLE